MLVLFCAIAFSFSVVGADHAPCLVEAALGEVARSHPDFKVSGIAEPAIEVCPALNRQDEHI